MSFEEAQNTFLAESRELLEEMEAALLQWEHRPGDRDLVNAIFRAAHTIKGSSGVFGFDDVEAFTHVVENILDQIRSDKLEVDADLLALLLSSCDQMGALVEAAVSGVALDSQSVALGAELRRKLESYLGAKSSKSALPVEHVGSVESDHDDHGDKVVNDNWHLSVRFKPDVLQNGLDPLGILRYLKRLGELVSVTTLTDGLPGFEQYDPELCYLGLEIDFKSDADRDQIESAFDFFRESAEIHLLPPFSKIESYIALIGLLPEENLKLGEILVKGGALTEKELQRVIGIQLEKGTPPRLGELLVSEGVVPKVVVDAAAEKQAQSRQKVSRTIRVDAEKLDQLINLVGELVIAGATTHLLSQRLADEGLQESVSLMSRLVEEIRDSALRLRMVQIGETFSRFQRVVRDVSREIGKVIQLEISGAETELDKTVVERIGDPLMHLVRNAMDHGIETAEERLAAGKPAHGTLKLHAYHDSGSIVIEVQDDGRGLDANKILAKAREKGLVGATQQLSNQEIYRLIFEAGFSTADKVTNLSGRGVGMDVVKRNIEALRGTVELDTKLGQGTTITIRLPLTLAIIDGFLVGVGDSSYVIPLDMVIECIEVGDEERAGASAQADYINLRGEVLPFLRLHDLFDETRKMHQRENIVVVQYGGQKAGLVVDELLGEFQTVIKPLGKIFQKLSGISGATILGSGHVAVILDIPQLVQAAVARGQGRARPAAATLH